MALHVPWLLTGPGALPALSRLQGKAAIDVVGAQSGKSIGSVLQQALLILRCARGPGGGRRLYQIVAGMPV